MFLKEEKEIDYVWILEMVKSIFDNGMTLLTLVTNRKIATLIVIK